MNIKRTPQTLNIPTLTSASIEGGRKDAIPLDRQQYLYGVDIAFVGRLTTAGGAAASVNPETPFNLLDRIQVDFNHEIWGSRNIINLSGATIFRRAHILQGTQPIASGGIAVGNAAYDLEIHWPVRFPLERLRPFEQNAMLLDAPRCGSLTLTLTWNKGSNLAPTGGATTYAWAASGGGGNPSLFVTLLQVNGLKGSPLMALCTKEDRNDSIAAAVALNNQVGNELTLGGALGRIWLKQYAQDTLSPIDVAATMNRPVLQTSAGLSRPQFMIDRRAVREWELWAQLEQQNKTHFGLETWPSGYGVIDWCEHGMLRDALDTRGLQAKRSVITNGGLVNALANGRLEVGFDQVFPNPKL